MNDHVQTERIHDLVDGLLSSAERAEVERHLGACPACRETAAELAALRTELAALPREAKAPEGLWGGIRERMADAGPGREAASSRVLSFPGAEVRRRVALSLPQLAAAAAVVALVSAGAVWLALGGARQGAPGGEMAGVETVGPARMVSSGEASYRQATAELEAVLEAGRALLTPETVAALERSLATIDQAIVEVEEALARDPSSELLGRMLVNHQGTRLRVLRQAVAQVPPRI